MTALLLPGETLTLGVNVIVRPGDEVCCDGLNECPPECGTPLAPQAWVALTGPCPTCGDSDDPGQVIWPSTGCLTRCDECAGTGRRIVPLYTECPGCHGTGWQGDEGDIWHCEVCSHEPGSSHNERRSGRVLVGRGSIEVVPVVDVGSVLTVTGDHVYVRNGVALLMTNGPDWHELTLPLDPLPVPGRDFGIVIDCVELAS